MDDLVDLVTESHRKSLCRDHAAATLAPMTSNSQRSLGPLLMLSAWMCDWVMQSLGEGQRTRSSTVMSLVCQVPASTITAATAPPTNLWLSPPQAGLSCGLPPSPGACPACLTLEFPGCVGVQC